MQFKGESRPAYTLLCLMYYSVKSLVLLCSALIFHIFKFFLQDIWNLIFNLEEKSQISNGFEIEDECEEEDYEEEDIYSDGIEELPFCQLFNLDENMCLIIDHVEMCPEETAFIRVVSDEEYTPIYKRKIRRDKAKRRFIIFNGTNYYLDDKKTQPVIHRKEVK